MERKVDKELDKLTEKLLKDFSRETPSVDFTTKVMARLEVSSETPVISYSPLISKKTWAVLAVVITSIFVYLIFGNIQIEDSWAISKIAYLWPEVNTLVLPSFKISNAFLYGIVGFTIFAGIQFFLLKNHFDKRFALH
ncbi:hypothetical protein ACEZ3G_15305 [Maribacter algicola]|uniref:Uncharacterized protein n=1 Tax=Meishania litoralis TaxID=3434685 RepID=A0ACC7LM62_9FLAO